MVLHKLVAGGVIDRYDAAELLRLNFRALDRTYLADWMQRLAVEAEFAQAWN